MRRRAIERLLVDWQIRLGLADWDLDIEVVDPKKIPGCAGVLDYVCEERAATIRINKEEPDPESVLVHELLHCWTRSIREYHKENLIEEQALEAIGAALLDIRRNDGG